MEVNGSVFKPAIVFYPRVPPNQVKHGTPAAMAPLERQQTMEPQEITREDLSFKEFSRVSKLLNAAKRLGR